MKEVKDLLISNKVVQRGDFILTSGAKSNVYIDIKKASTNPLILRKICEEISTHIGKCDRIGGMELGSIPLVVSTSLIKNIPFLMIRKNKRYHGSSSQIEGLFDVGMEIVIIEDVTTSGKSITRTIEILRNAGLKVMKAISVVDREMGASDEVSKFGVDFISLVSISELTSLDL